ncbi:tyrosine-type recombinase/integrase [Streptomyces sp. NPDC051104]|uniref:tyrosine-type recombinase/integrase n=1 Tax=Streptomyces sp. NPDC051104 TaxID=3155044 RepID=UPI0034476B37
MPAPRKKTRANGEGTIYQRKDGRWEAAGYVLTTDGRRKRVRVYGSTRREAADKLTEKMAASNSGHPVATGSDTLGDYLAYWLNNVALHRVRANTHERYRTCVRLYLLPGLGNKKLAQLTARDVRTFLDRLRTTCQCCACNLDAAPRRCCAIGNCCDRRLSPLTVAYVHSVLKSALEHAVREDELPRNVARNVKLTPARHRRFEPLTADEARHFLKVARQDKLRALWELALRAGLRRGELLGLTWADLDPTAGTLNIRRSLQHNPAGGLTLFPTKTRAAERRIALPTVCLAALEQHRQEQERQRIAAGPRWRESGLIFTSRVGTPLDPSDIARRFTGLLHQAGIRRIRFHDLRHTCATLLLEQGVQLVTIKELLGHANIGITAQIYAHVRLRLQHDAINQLTDVLQNGDDPEDPPMATVPAN